MGIHTIFPGENRVDVDAISNTRPRRRTGRQSVATRAGAQSQPAERLTRAYAHAGCWQADNGEPRFGSSLHTREDLGNRPASSWATTD